MKNKEFDCVDMKRNGAATVYKKVRYMTDKEQLNFWNHGTEKLRQIKVKSLHIHNSLK